MNTNVHTDIVRRQRVKGRRHVCVCARGEREREREMNV